ncbi:MAG: hypothetical protein O8C62_07330 [Candidatus Methanoperedens sp.]|nr:hypothetical protein [Candidatus Methanoperedens sp.]
MTKIKSLYDAIKYKKPENQCTNFLAYLLEKLPNKKIIDDICKNSGLTINEYMLSVNVQYPLKVKDGISIPDAIMIFSNRKYLIIEAKMSKGDFKKSQFINHFNGGKEEFGGKENIWMLFLSGDDDVPGELNEFKKMHPERIGFLSWHSLLTLLDESKASLGERYEIIIEEFSKFLSHNGIRRVIPMDNEELKNFIENYSKEEEKKRGAFEKFSKTINKIQEKIITDFEDVEPKHDLTDFPCFYRCLKIADWHFDYSSYIFLDIISKKIGVVLTGYEDSDEYSKGQLKEIKEEFLGNWDEKYKDKYKVDSELCALTWFQEYEDDDEYPIKATHFKIIEGTSGKPIKPGNLPAFEDRFYFGYVHELEIEKLNTYPEIIAKDFNKLFNNFIKNNKLTRKSKKATFTRKGN